MPIQTGNTIISSSARGSSNIEPAEGKAIVYPIQQKTFRGEKKKKLRSHYKGSTITLSILFKKLIYIFF
jgi:hypothetical protein